MLHFLETYTVTFEIWEQTTNVDTCLKANNIKNTNDGLSDKDRARTEEKIE